MRVFASATARTVAGEEEVCRVHVGERGREGERERDREETREKEREAATMKSSSCQPGRAFTVWSYPGERETRCGWESGRGGDAERCLPERQADEERSNLPTLALSGALQAARDSLSTSVDMFFYSTLLL